MSLSSIFESISSKSKDEDEDENEKTAVELYQEEIEGVKGLKLPGEIESKDEKSQIYLENNLNKIKNNFSDIYDKYQRFFKYIANEEKSNMDYEILSIKGVNLFDRYGTLYDYLNYFSAEEISTKNKSFLENLSKEFKPKSVYTTGNINNTEKAYSDLVLKNKTIDDVLYKNSNKQLSDRNKNIFQEARKVFDLRVEIYKKLILEEENLKFEESVGERVKLKNQGVNLAETPEQKEFKDF